MKRLLHVFAFLSALSTIAQPGKEAWHWRFGYNCSIDFSSGLPITSIISTPFSVSEGCAVMNDINTGQFLFFVEATQIINKNNATMYNGSGLIGNQNASQSSLIVPNPANSNIYYVITADHSVISNKGIHYSVVDMGQQGGLGAVTIKNQLLTPPPTTEKLAAVRHCNGVDYWILTHSHNSNTFNAYQVTSAGINTTPVISNTGIVHEHLGSYYSGSGYLKFSPDGKKVALGLDFDSIPILQIFDFNNSTGLVSNPITVYYPGTWGPYGLSFSPDNSKLYTTVHTINNDSSLLYQYDLSSGVPSTIVASQILIDFTKTISTSTGWLGAAQIAPDGKIYIARYNTDTLAVINNPNNVGANCNFIYNGFPLPSSVRCLFGLPNFIDANYAGIHVDIPDVKQCSNFPEDTLNADTGFVSYQWSTGATTNSIVINSPGIYWVTVTNDQGCSATDTSHAYLINPIKKDTSACDSCIVNATENIVLHYNWFDNDTNSIKTFNNTGIYWIDISYIGGCSVRDTYNISVNPSPIVSLGNDTAFCVGNLLLNAENPSSSYIWSTGQTTSGITATKPSTYWVKITNQFGCEQSDTLVVYPQTSLLNFIMPNIITPNGDHINDEIDFGKYQFSALNIEIFDRWGLKIFESTEPDCIWKPDSNMVDGTYFVSLQYRIDCGESFSAKTIKEFITLIR